MKFTSKGNRGLMRATSLGPDQLLEDPWTGLVAIYPSNDTDGEMKLISPDNSELMQVSSLERDGDSLVIKGSAFGAMPISAKLSPEQARAALKLLDLKTFVFLLTLLFRRGSRGGAAA